MIVCVSDCVSNYSVSEGGREHTLYYVECVFCYFVKECTILNKHVCE